MPDLDTTLVECPNGHRTEPRQFEFVTGDVGTVNYCRDCGAEMEVARA